MLLLGAAHDLYRRDTGLGDRLDPTVGEELTASVSLRQMVAIVGHGRLRSGCGLVVLTCGVTRRASRCDSGGLDRRRLCRETWRPASGHLVGRDEAP